MADSINPDDERERVKKALRRIGSELKHAQDQQLARLRSYWNQWDADQRSEFKEWISKIADLKRSQPDVFPQMSIRIEFIEQVGDDDYDKIAPSIEGMSRAVEFWERGEDYGPNAIEELI